MSGRPFTLHEYAKRRCNMAWLYVVSTNDPETVYNAVRLANVSLDNKKEVNLFMLGRGVEFNEISTEEFDVNSQIEQFYEKGGELIA